eukprot:1120396-Alexandrium_andersonii.AAC.1
MVPLLLLGSWPRPPCPQELHRWDWLQQQKALGNVRSAAHSQTWADWREAFGNATPEELQSYQQQAEWSEVASRANRARRKERPLALASAPADPPPPPSLALREAPANAVVLADPSEQALRHVALVGQAVVPRRAVGDVESFCSSCRGPLPDFPLGEGELAQAGSYAKVIGRFRAQCGCNERSADDAFPPQVAFPRHCGALCQVHSPPEQLDLYHDLLRAFGTCVQRFGVGAGVARADCIIAAELHSGSAGHARVLFLDLREAHGRCPGM